jgi:transcription-repair coupling factor (superfamily II helicase)
MVITGDLFGSKSHRPQPRRSKTAPFLTSFRELRPGDLVIHRDYGVGEYTGLSHISVDGFETDFLALRYEPDAKLYVPLYSLDKVQKFAGVEGSVPRLDRLGGQSWSRTKEKIKKDLLEMARTLIALSAAREARERPAFSAPDTMYRDFEAAFPYEETQDQQRAIEDVLADMQRQRPMDRLVCGDVGYGKTEVALRAAFKAVEDGLQVAILVPNAPGGAACPHLFRSSPRSPSVSICSPLPFPYGGAGDARASRRGPWISSAPRLLRGRRLPEPWSAHR